MAEAYVLAGELRSCGNDYASAFARYEQRLRPLLKTKQASAPKFARAFAPKSAFGVGIRNLVSRALGLPGLADFLVRRDLRDDVEIPEYRL